MKYPKLKHFDPRGSMCPICKRGFRYGCNHSVAEAEERLERNHLAAVVRYELARAETARAEGE